MILSQQQKAAVEEAIARAEEKTTGEIVTVIARASGDYYYVPYLWAALTALIAPAPLILWTWMPVQTIYFLQLAVFAIVAIILHYEPLRFALVPRAVKKGRAHRRAVEQFLAQKLHTVPQHTGVLVYVSVAERYAEIIADRAAHEKLSSDNWKRIVSNLTAAMGMGQPAEGLIAAVQAIGEVLAAHFPATPGTKHTLPNQVVILPGN